MIDQATARSRVEAHLNEGGSTEYRFVIADEHTIERPYGWVFFWTTERFRATGDPRYAIVGNSPILVLKRDGTLHPLGTAFPAEMYLNQYELENSGDG